MPLVSLVPPGFLLLIGVGFFLSKDFLVASNEIIMWFVSERKIDRLGGKWDRNHM